MSTFWLGAGAAAALILAILGVLQYARSGCNLLVSVRQYEFELPATAQQAFAKLAERISPWSDEPLVGIDDEVAGGVEAILKVFGIRVGPRLRTFWKITLTNRGPGAQDGEVEMGAVSPVSTSPPGLHRALRRDSAHVAALVGRNFRADLQSPGVGVTGARAS